MTSVVIFDLDDTLYDEIDYCRSGFSAVAEYLSVSKKSLHAEDVFNAFWEKFEAGERKEVFNKALDEIGMAYPEHAI